MVVSDENQAEYKRNFDKPPKIKIYKLKNFFGTPKFSVLKISLPKKPNGT